MPAKRGFSAAIDPVDAVRQLLAQIDQPAMALVVFFASPIYDREALAKAIRDSMPGIEVIGCTTAGEITSEGYRENTLTGVSFGRADYRASIRLVSDLDRFRMEAGSTVVQELLGDLGLGPLTARSVPGQVFGMLLIDGMSRQEEVVVSSISRFLDPVPLFGGSAGDGLDFGVTWVFAHGAFHTNAAVLALIETNHPFSVFKLDHFRPTGKKMVVTEADPARRLVMEINAEKAAPAYAKMVGLDERDLNPMTFAAYPVVVRVGGEYHVRSIQKVEEDGSLRFYCGIDEGLVLTVADGDDIAKNLDQALTRVAAELGSVELILGFDCILRRLEAEQKQKTLIVSQVLKRHGVVGFNTYGEQYRSMHVNQTFTGVAIGRTTRKPEERRAS
ncbi:nitric oxide-sensing protein NosP [Taklimakanibacter deserti]|uniref:nitric oxide-sensing protein NosP n=1 Tax=Taklimakanibacter deserti TaxID=2267839 RepID=UPI000E6545A4